MEEGVGMASAFLENVAKRNYSEYHRWVLLGRGEGNPARFIQLKNLKQKKAVPPQKRKLQFKVRTLWPQGNAPWWPLSVVLWSRLHGRPEKKNEQKKAGKRIGMYVLNETEQGGGYILTRKTTTNLDRESKNVS